MGSTRRRGVYRALAGPALLLLLFVSACRCGGSGSTDAGTDAGGADGGGCQMNTQCPPERPICESSSATCRACAADSECGAGFVCVPGGATAGACEPPAPVCQEDADCVGTPARAHCDPSSSTCAACTSDTHCPGLGQICDPESRTCVAPPSCVDDSSCVDPARSRCEVGSGRCVACVIDADCNLATRQSCDTATNTCADFVPCVADLDCADSPDGPRCDTGRGDCVGCLSDADCLSGTGRVCDATQKICTGGVPCIDDGACAGLATPICDAHLGTCVACIGGSDCTPAGATCDVAQRACRPPLPCLNDAECTDPVLPLCDPAVGACAECLLDADCSNALAACVGGICDAGPPAGGRAGSACTIFTDCEGASALPADQYSYTCLEPDDPIIPWKWYGGYCLGFCQLASECPGGATCLGGACWDTCATDAACRAGYACQPLQAGGVVQNICIPSCDEALISKRACVTDFDCPLGVCNQQTGFCGCSPVGGACVGPGACRPDAGCIAETDANGDPTGWPGGYCIVVDCDPPASPCPAGSSCYTLPGDVNACLPDCDPNALASCGRAKYGCAEVDRFIIGSACSGDAECSVATPDCYGASAGVQGTCIRACASDAGCDRSQGHICADLQGQVSLCADPFQGGACYPGCATDAACGVCAVDGDCAIGQVCDAARCRTPCSTDAQCGVGNVCVGGVCAVVCATDIACPRGATCVGGGCTVPAVQCDPVARRCDTPCDVGIDCDRARSCDPATRSCFTACSAAGDDCGPAGRCDPQLGACVPDCRVLPAICAADTYCDGATGACLDRCGNFGRGTCAAPEICDLFTGACVTACTTLLGADCSGTTPCAADEVCWLGNCAARCDRDSDCGPELLCQYSYACSPCDTSRWRCDVGGTDLCVDCIDDNNCASRSYCDIGGTHACVERCGGVNGGGRTCNPGEVCDVSAGGLCRAPCAIDAECLDPLRPYCSTSSGLCGACATDAECVGDPAGPACDPLSLSCVACVDDLHCSDPAAPACDPATASCVGCVRDAHCATSPLGPRCDLTAQACVACLADADCPAITPICDLATRACLPCVADAECAPGALCHFAVNGGECHAPCGQLAAQHAAEPNFATGLAGFDDGAGGAANFSHFRLSNDVWAYTLDVASVGADQASVDLLIFGLTLPPGETLVGVSVEVEASTEADPTPGADQWQVRVALLAPGGVVSAPQIAPAFLGPVDTTALLGGSADLWGLTLGATEVADVSFGVRLALTELGAAPDVRARVDRVQIILHTIAPGGTLCDTLATGLVCNLVENRCQ